MVEPADSKRCARLPLDRGRYEIPRDFCIEQNRDCYWQYVLPKIFWMEIRLSKSPIVSNRHRSLWFLCPASQRPCDYECKIPSPRKVYENRERERERESETEKKECVAVFWKLLLVMRLNHCYTIYLLHLSACNFKWKSKRSIKRTLLCE